MFSMLLKDLISDFIFKTILVWIEWRYDSATTDPLSHGLILRLSRRKSEANTYIIGVRSAYVCQQGSVKSYFQKRLMFPFGNGSKQHTFFFLQRRARHSIYFKTFSDLMPMSFQVVAICVAAVGCQAQGPPSSKTKPAPPPMQGCVSTSI